MVVVVGPNLSEGDKVAVMIADIVFFTHNGHGSYPFKHTLWNKFHSKSLYPLNILNGVRN